MAIGELIVKNKDIVLQWFTRLRENLLVMRFSRRAHGSEKKKKYRVAVENYLKLIEIKLRIVGSRPGTTIETYLAIVPVYVKLAECYENINHITPEERILDHENASRYYIRAAVMYSDQRNYCDAHNYYEHAARCYEEVEEYDNAGDCYIKIAEMYSKLENRVLSASQYIRAAEFYEKIKNHKKAAELYIRAAIMNLDMRNYYTASQIYKLVGQCYNDMGEYEDSIGYYARSVELSSDIGEYSNITSAYDGIASSYRDIDDYDNAIHYYLRAAGINNSNDDGINASSGYGHAGKCFEEIKNYKSAIKYYKMAADIRFRLGEFTGAAHSHMGVARCYESENNYEKAAEAYFQCADYGALNKEESEYAKGYKRAAEIYAMLAGMRLAEQDYLATTKEYKNAAESYIKFKDYKRAGDMYYKSAEIETENDYGTATQTWITAAETYKETGDLRKVGWCYVKSGDYLNAAETYTNDAKQKSSGGDISSSAEGYRSAGDCYKKLKNHVRMRDSYNKAIHLYLRYAEKIEYIWDAENKLGDIYRNIAESYFKMGDALNSKKYFEEALKYYDKSGMEKEKTITLALLSKTNATFAIKVGDYKTAIDLLEESGKLLESSLKIEWGEEYTQFLEENKKEVAYLLETIGIKPEVGIEIEQPAEPFPRSTFNLMGTVLNGGAHPVYNVSFLPNLPKEFRQTKKVDVIDVLEGGESREISMELESSSTGKFVVIPLQMIYNDKSESKYMKASNEVMVEISNNDSD